MGKTPQLKQLIWKALSLVGLLTLLLAALGTFNGPVFGQVLNTSGSVTYLGLGASGVISADGQWIIYNGSTALLFDLRVEKRKLKLTRFGEPTTFGQLRKFSG